MRGVDGLGILSNTEIKVNNYLIKRINWLVLNISLHAVLSGVLLHMYVRAFPSKKLGSKIMLDMMGRTR